jgi:hypothetical protein
LLRRIDVDETSRHIGVVGSKKTRGSQMSIIRKIAFFAILSAISVVGSGYLVLATVGLI